MQNRVFNFSAGPAVLPLPALQEAQRDLLLLPGAGSSVMEISHRSKTFTEIIERAEANVRQLLNIPDGYHVLFLQGGATMQFGMIPLNLLRGPGKSADYVVTGSWGAKALKDAMKVGDVRVAFDGSPTKFTSVPSADDLTLNPDAAYLHYTSNETIQGVQFQAEPDVGDVPLVCDASSDILCRPIPIEKYGIVYAGAQKNIGPSGVTLVIMRDDLMGEPADDLPTLLTYRPLAEAKSLLNTPPTFGIYMVKLVTDWLLSEFGDLEKMHAHNRRKAQLLYDVIDSSADFYQPHADASCRSIMNVTFRLSDSDLDARFASEAAQRGLVALKGHRSVGGFRASIYNAMPIEGVEALANFMQEFRG